jgi:hypothetical protein
MNLWRFFSSLPYCLTASCFVAETNLPSTLYQIVKGGVDEGARNGDIGKFMLNASINSYFPLPLGSST